MSLPRWPIVLAALWFGAGAGAACAQSSAPAEAAPSAVPAAAPLVYVSDFELDAANVTTDPNPVDQARHLGGGLLPRPLSRLRGEDPQAKARDIVEEMASTLVADLRRAGVDARRLPTGAPTPAQGWLVRGVFLQVDEGNRMRRAMVGFGAGASEVQLAVAIDDLAAHAPAPLYQVIDTQSSHKMPGAGAAIALNPYVAAAKFVIARGDQRLTVERAAGQVADTVSARVKTAP
ncbi:conserved exported hypothetical protein [Paraburkholderia tropica]|uniref:DUF4410 domain-containing protein n=1 Tax=Paraburkholderia TaxID=1822464 RepID=UPI001CAE9F6A|nr:MULTISPECIES: DUF4410 domain-containing protein [Paraburkholderia]CAG9216487.1 conserved exported hypothetical protein [Paraburkholderia tropica]